MSIKICPECKFANKRGSLKCTQCGNLLQEVETMGSVVLPDIIPILPKQHVACPHCDSGIDIEGGGRLKCPKCTRFFEYYGPYQLECQKCRIKISLTSHVPKKIDSCPNCGQKYN